ncbi:hypothetical protein BV25DRAFT_1991360 [Artomyces pyxidatus]|uniref:Uncharacterized protein n=1 Tax=Artomyces pyxidatus TaxID=48021 RepID=A0ACB8T121_9AGAM|nr:hypothetical protein BV25DRAFT_1991360 [Artomyces pyxidatus]
MSAYTSPTLSSGAPTLRRNSAFMSTPSRPTPETPLFRKRLTRRLKAVRPANKSLGSTLRYVGYNALDKLRRLAKAGKATEFVQGPPPSRAPTITAPWIFITPPDEPHVDFRPIRRQTRIRSTSGLRGAREAARTRREAASAFPPTPIPDAKEPCSIDFDALIKLMSSPQQADFFDQLDLLLTSEEQAEVLQSMDCEAYTPKFVEWSPSLEPWTPLFADTPMLATGFANGSDSDLCASPATPNVEDMVELPDRFALYLQDPAQELGAVDELGHMDEEYQEWILDLQRQGQSAADYYRGESLAFA